MEDYFQLRDKEHAGETAVTYFKMLFQYFATKFWKSTQNYYQAHEEAMG
jgi:hypothetical protein